MPKSPNFCSATGPRKRESRNMSARTKVAVLTGFLLCISTLSAGKIFPQLKWNEPPANAKSFALIMDDPDAPVGTWVHWVLYDLPADTGELPEGVAKQEQLASGARQGRNDFGKSGYGGPCT